jgi:hypothetical protein
MPSDRDNRSGATARAQRLGVALALGACVAACVSGPGHAPPAGDPAAGDRAGDATGLAGGEGGDADGVLRPPFEISVWETCNAAGGCSAYAGVGNYGLDTSEWRPTLTVGECSYVEPAELACAPACEIWQVCLDGHCVDRPDPVSAGRVTVNGLKVGLALVPETAYHYYQVAFTPEPADGDLFDEGDRVTATAAGDEVPAFAIETLGVAPVVTSLACPPVLVAGQALSVSWTPSAQGEPVHFALRSINHANQFSAIDCESADDGSLTVDGAVVSRYLEDVRPGQLWILSRRHSAGVAAGDWQPCLTAEASASCSFY